MTPEDLRKLANKTFHIDVPKPGYQIPAPEIDDLRAALRKAADDIEAAEARAERYRNALEAAEAVCEAVTCTGLDINPPDGPDRHADIYSLDNWSVRQVASTMDAWRTSKEAK